MKWIQKKLSRKLGLAFCFVVGATLFAADLLLIRDLKTHLLEELKENLRTQARQLSVSLPRDIFFKSDLQFQTFIQKVDRQAGARVTLIRKDGLVTADSQVDWKDLGEVENHSNRPEVVEALQSGFGSNIRHSQTIGVNLLYIAIPYPLEEDYVGTIRLAIPLTRVNREISEFSHLVLVSTFTAICVGLILVLAMARWMTHPLMQINQVIGSFSEAVMSTRVVVSTLDEVGDLATSFNKMADKLESALQQITSEKDELAAILGSMVEHVIAVDSSWNILLMNPSAERLFKVDGQLAIGKPFVEVIRLAAISDILRDVLENRQEKFDEVQIYLPDEKYFEVRSMPIKSGGRDGGALLVLHDITRIQKLEKVRRDFVANVSHELRTPITSIKGFAETLLSGALSDSVHNREFVETIYSESERLTRLVEDLLNLSSIESGKMKPVFATVSLRKLLKEVEESLKPLAKKHAVTVQNNLAEDLKVNADESQLKQLFMNLMDNAIKFNKKEGSVILNASTENGSATISIEDTGMGIPESDLPRIFERFYRVDKNRSRELGGTGLGLSIVKHIVEAHQGTIQVESQFEKGSVFSITIPISS